MSCVDLAGRRSCPTNQPLLELHWKHSAIRYGFCGAQGMQQHWWSSCNEEFDVSISNMKHVIMLTSESGVKKQIPYDKVKTLVEAVFAGFIIKETQFAFRRHNVGVVKMVLQKSITAESSFLLVCLDLQKDLILGSFQINDSKGSDAMHHVEIFDLALSSDGRVLALSVALVRNCHFLFEASENMLILYDTVSMRELCRLQNTGHVVSSAAFDPRFGHCQFSVAGVYDNATGHRSLITYSLHQPTPVRSAPIEDLLDVDGDTQLEVSYSKGGDYIFLQVLEPVGPTKEWMYTTYLYKADTLEKLVRYSPSLLRSCHVSCAPIALPLVSRCGTYIALANDSGKHTGDFYIRVHRLPCQLDLRAQCRTAILRALSPSCTENLVNHLPLPKVLAEFLMWKRNVFICTEEHLPDERNSGDSDEQCSCSSENGDETNKDASWYTGNDDVPTDPSRKADMLHRRARNEVYS